jgi:hypothetical protein
VSVLKFLMPSLAELDPYLGADSIPERLIAAEASDRGVEFCLSSAGGEEVFKRAGRRRKRLKRFTSVGRKKYLQ